jgi:hypothetical protein
MELEEHHGFDVQQVHQMMDMDLLFHALKNTN